MMTIPKDEFGGSICEVLRHRLSGKRRRRKGEGEKRRPIFFSFSPLLPFSPFFPPRIMDSSLPLPRLPAAAFSSRRRHPATAPQPPFPAMINVGAPVRPAAARRARPASRLPFPCVGSLIVWTPMRGVRKVEPSMSELPGADDEPAGRFAHEACPAQVRKAWCGENLGVGIGSVVDEQNERLRPFAVVGTGTVPEEPSRWLKMVCSLPVRYWHLDREAAAVVSAHRGRCLPCRSCRIKGADETLQARLRHVRCGDV